MPTREKPPLPSGEGRGEGSASPSPAKRTDILSDFFTGTRGRIRQAADWLAWGPVLPTQDVTGPRLRAVGAAFLVRRPFIVGPLVVLAIGLLHLSGAPGKQTLALTVGCSVMMGFFLFEAVRF